MNRKEFLIYCLLDAFDVAGIKKQNLVQMALKVDTVTFVKIYNIIQQHDADLRKEIININKVKLGVSEEEIESFIKEII